MKIRPIRTEQDYEKALQRLDVIFDATAGTMEGWLDSLQTTIAPDATGRVICAADTQICDVGVRWSDERATGGSQAQEINIRSRI